MKAIRIDVTNKSVSMIELAPSDDALREALGCEYLLKLPLADPDSTDCIYIDQASCLRQLEDIYGGCHLRLTDAIGPFLGHVVIVGTNPLTGQLTDCELSVDDVTPHVAFLTQEQVTVIYNYSNGRTLI